MIYAPFAQKITAADDTKKIITFNGVGIITSWTLVAI